MAERPARNFGRPSRDGSTGLIWLVQGRPVFGVTETQAAIQSAGALESYRRPNSRAPRLLGDCLDDGADGMSNRAARITQVEIERAIRAAKKAGATEVEVRIGDEASIRIPLAPDKPVAEAAKIIL